MKNDIPFGLLVQFVLMSVVGAGLFYWSQLLAYSINKYNDKLYHKFPSLKHRPTSKNRGGKLSNSVTSFRVCGAFLLAFGVSSILGIVVVLTLVRFHTMVTFFQLCRIVAGQFLILFLALLLSPRRQHPALEK